ncbi:2458_t:CDS:2 [Funneliformis caledonium]|uniref:2458_t:CDS:1 n=1 Tax=Funneliformis caledonium TaxID=1117310 RepID=A0A9N9D3S4_9GLOM|nr:2458_t:CDS:2 [Funneliformis caledonium]
MRRKAELSLSLEIVFTEELEKCIGKNNLGIYLNIAYEKESFIQLYFYNRKKVIFDTDPFRTITTHFQSIFKLSEDKLYNQLLIDRLGSFNLTEEYKNLF